ncbi:MAG TPA: SDR family oxidoreductase [Polyangiaceae bacterium]|jgi:NAD(P)-dependent dehydrogenase (short-subunit alcohol dehydrogenase family)
MSLIEVVKGTGPSGFGYGSTAEDVTRGLDLTNRVIVVTGCNSGIGWETARVLAMRGAKVIATARTEEKARAACAAMSGSFVPLACDLSAPSSVRAAIDAVKNSGLRLDAIVCNAGIMALPELKQAFGYELQFFTNHVGHFMLVTGLLSALVDDGRVVMVSSDAHRRAPRAGIEFDNLSGEKHYSPWKAYGQSKLANLLFARELGRQLKLTKKTANALHPGVIRTNLVRNMSSVIHVAWRIAAPLFMKSIAQGAATQCYLAVHPKVSGITGEYFSDCNVGESTAAGRDDALAAQLWKATESIVAGLP